MPQQQKYDGSRGCCGPDGLFSYSGGLSHPAGPAKGAGRRLRWSFPLSLPFDRETQPDRLIEDGGGEGVDIIGDSSRGLDLPVYQLTVVLIDTLFSLAAAPLLRLGPNSTKASGVAVPVSRALGREREIEHMAEARPVLGVVG